MEKALDLVKGSVEKKFGKGILMKLTDEPVVDPNNIVPSGSINVDSALGIGGYRKGRIVEIYGPESSGKTTLCLHAVASAQMQDKICAFIDAEHSLDPTYAKHLGVDLDKLLVSQPDYGEQALELADMLAKSGEVGLIVIDSVAALVPQKELEGEMGDSHVGLQARMMSQAMRKLAGTVNQTGCIIIFVNQIRMKIGVMFGSPETTTGGGALKFYASQRLDIRRIGAIKRGDKIIGNRTKVKVVKNKLAPPFREAEFDIRYGIGIDQIAEILDLAVEDDVVRKAGAWYSYKDDRIGQGRENAISYLKENDDLRNAIKNEVLDLRGLGCPEEETSEQPSSSNEESAQADTLES
jgi:recombination protein RecA